MLHEQTPDLLISFSILNYLNASLQGKFAGLNILSQLRPSDGTTQEIAKTRESLAKVNEWTQNLWQGTPVFMAAWTSAESFDAMKAVELLKALRGELTELARAVDHALVQDLISQHDYVRLLVSAYGRYAYSRDNYIRGFIDYGTQVNDQELIEQNNALLQETAPEVQTAHALLGVTRDIASADEAFFFELAWRCGDLPMVFRAQAHDLTQLVAPYSGGLTFEFANFPRPQADAWMNAGFNPASAGYWRAYEFSADEAIAWGNIGAGSSTHAHQWRKAGFQPETAASWMAIQAPPMLAQSWRNAGFSSEEALRYLQQGIMDPAAVEQQS